MIIETYEIEEIKSSEASTMAADSEACELIEKLGLDGQKTLMNPDTETRFQYPRLTAQEAIVYLTLLPAKTTLKEYKSGIIPLRVLQVAAFCKDFPQCSYLYVFHPKNNDPDPLLVGCPSLYSTEYYKLARWGEVLLPFEKLEEKALQILCVAGVAKLKECQSKIHAILGDIKNSVRAEYDKGETFNPTFYV